MNSTVPPARDLLWLDLVELLDRARARFGLPRGVRLEPIRRRKRVVMDGQAFRRPPVIELRLHRCHRPRQAMKRSTIMATFAHEMAHLVPGSWEHGPKHRSTTRDVAAWLREQGEVVAPMLFAPTHPRRRAARARRRRARQRSRKQVG